MFDITSISAAYDGLKLGKELLSSVYNKIVDASAKEQVDAVMARLGDAQDTLFAMREELFRLQSDNETLRRQIAESEDWDSKTTDYELVETSGGAVVYKFNSNPEHYICPSCYSKKTIEILQDNRTISGKFRCVGCGAEFPINPSRNR